MFVHITKIWPEYLCPYFDIQTVSDVLNTTCEGGGALEAPIAEMIIDQPRLRLKADR